MSLAQDLLDQAKKAKREPSEERPSTPRRESSSRNTSTFKVPAEVRQKRVGKVMELLQRESELVEETQKRLSSLSLAPAAA